jgi:hypothetical protein
LKRKIPSASCFDWALAPGVFKYCKESGSDSLLTRFQGVFAGAGSQARVSFVERICASAIGVLNQTRHCEQDRKRFQIRVTDRSG